MLLADDDIQMWVSLNEPVQHSVISESGADQHNLVKLAIEWAAELVHEKLHLGQVGRPHAEHVEWDVARIHFNTAQDLPVCL